MKIACFHDAQRLREGGASLARLAVALLTEGLRVVRVIPDSADPGGDDPNERSICLIPRLVYPRTVPWWLRPARRERLLEALERDPPDVIYACGRTCWSLARRCAEELECPLVIELAGRGELDRFEERRYVRSAAGVVHLRSAPGDGRVGADGDMGERAAGSAITETLRPGVAVPDEARPLEAQHSIGSIDSRGSREAADAGAQRSPALALVGGCTELTAWEPVVEALAALASQELDWHAAIELRGSAAHQVWRLFRDRGLLPRIAPLADAEVLGGLVRQCDLMLVVEPQRKVSIPCLEAMAAALPIVAAPDDWLPLTDGETGVVLRTGPGHGKSRAVDAWRSAIDALCRDPERRRRLGGSARTYVQRWHTTSAQAEGLLGLFDRLGGATVLPFPRARA